MIQEAQLLYADWRRHDRRAGFTGPRLTVMQEGRRRGAKEVKINKMCFEKHKQDTASIDLSTTKEDVAVECKTRLWTCLPSKHVCVSIACVR